LNDDINSSDNQNKHNLSENVSFIEKIDQADNNQIIEE